MADSPHDNQGHSVLDRIVKPFAALFAAVAVGGVARFWRRHFGAEREAARPEPPPAEERHDGVLHAVAERIGIAKPEEPEEEPAEPAVSARLLQMLQAYAGVGAVPRHTGGPAEPQAAARAEAPKGYEPSDVNLRVLVWVAVGAAVFAVLLSVGLYFLFHYDVASVPDNPQAPAFAAPTRVPPAPRLQVDPPADLARYQATEQALLGSYGADPASGAIHIPIDQAIDLVAQRGLRAGATPQPGAAPVPTGGPQPTASPTTQAGQQGTGGNP